MLLLRTPHNVLLAKYYAVDILCNIINIRKLYLHYIRIRISYQAIHQVDVDVDNVKSLEKKK